MRIRELGQIKSRVETDAEILRIQNEQTVKTKGDELNLLEKRIETETVASAKSK